MEHKYKKIVLYFSCVLLFCAPMNLKANHTVPLSIHQVLQKKITLNVKNTTLEQILSQISKQTNVEYGYNSSDGVNKNTLFSLNVSGVTVENALKQLFKDGPYDYIIDGNKISIVAKKKTDVQNKKIAVGGKIVDSEKKPVIGATVFVLNSTAAAITNDKGEFSLSMNSGQEIEVSCVGMKTAIKKISAEVSNLVIVLENDEMAVEDVIVTGYFNRKIDSYTGNASVVKGAELRATNPTNVMKALAFLDPDIVIMENNQFGSDPNKTPSIHMQGTSSITTAKDQFISDPNLPTFILDGFEVSYQTIYDMDPNRIESIVVLKDAAASAIYGSRAANGVIVVNSVEPKHGKIILSYSLNLNFSSPDLDSYDLLNAQEKFDLETSLGVKSPTSGLNEYNKIRKWLAGGTDTDWLAQPTRNATTQMHTLSLMGGEKSLRYNLNFNYANSPGVMKGSKRSNYSVTADIIYRPSSKLNFKNAVTYSRNNSEDSPYGGFDTYTVMNPYFPIYDSEDELIPVYMDDGGAEFSGQNKNPLYTVLDGSFSKGKYSNFIENFSMDWEFIRNLRLKIALSYSEQHSQSDRFVSPESSTFIREEERSNIGSYTLGNTERIAFNGKASLSYSRMFGKHNLNANVGYEMSITDNESFSHIVTGFGSSYLNYIGFATKYKDGTVPSVNEGLVRTLSGYLSVNYTFDNKYLFDGSFRLDGSSQFGSEKRVAPFFSVGVGWNLHKENFLKDNKVITLLKIRGSYGQVGSVKFSAYQAKDTYSYFKEDRYMDNLGTYLLAYGNENLKWQITHDYNVGLDTDFFKNILSMSFNYYNKRTSNLLYDVVFPYSTGFRTYVENLGEMVNKGFSFSVRANIIKKPSSSLNVFVNGNQNNNENHSKYKDGKPISAIYATPSLGIDPASGRELYLDINGNPTWVNNPAHKRICGYTTPKLQGSFGVNATYKQFTGSIGFSYSFGSQQYNETLQTKVENANLSNNVDRRVLTDTWQKPGDNAKYGNPLGDAVGNSSRFIQENDYLNFNTFNITYNFNKDGFIKRLKLTSLQLSFNTNDLMYFSTIKRERGTSYPFARSFTFGLRANF